MHTPPQAGRRRAPWLTAVVACLCVPAVAGEPAPPGDLPPTLAQTGLFVEDSRALAPGVVRFTPQYPLWSDGAAKRRWMWLPPGTAIDASDPDAWAFPVGTRLWKEFRFGGPVETRMIEHVAEGRWRFAVYVWDEQGREATLAPEAGLSRHPVSDAPGGAYAIPSRDDCRACHEGQPVPVLGVSALQLSPDRDVAAPHAEPLGVDDLDLPRLVALGLVQNLPAELLEAPPRIAWPSATGRAALGYLHANCGHCHNAGPLDLLDMDLAQTSRGDPNVALRSLLDRPSEFQVGAAQLRVAPGQPESSVLTQRMKSRHPLAQMPPLGTSVPDAAGIALVEQWIRDELHSMPLVSYQQTVEETSP